MADAAALIDLGEVLVWVGAFILASLAYYIARGVASGLRHIPLIGGALASVTSGIEGYIVEPLNDVRKAAEAGITRGLSGLADSLAVFVGLAVLLGLGVKAALTYMWNTSLEARVMTWIVREIAKIDLPHIHLPSLTAAIAHDVRTALAPELKVIRTSVAAAHTLATTAEKDAQAALAKAVTSITNVTENVTRDVVTQTTQVVTQEVPGLAEALAGAAAELPHIGSDVIADLRGIMNSQDLTTLAGLLATIPLARAIVNTVVAEAGLDDEACRAKHKQICSVPASEWANLLGGLAAIGFAFSLRDLFEIAEPLVERLAPVIREAA